jgi:hypothetical protein
MNESSTVIRRKGAAAVAASRPLALFATVALGVEELTAGELQRLGRPRSRWCGAGSVSAVTAAFYTAA